MTILSSEARPADQRLDVWDVPDLIARVGAVDRSSALKALTTWIDQGVLKEDRDGHYRLLEIAEESAPRAGASRHGAHFRMGLKSDVADARIAVGTLMEEVPAVLAVQQQQAEQMKVFWKVCL